MKKSNKMSWYDWFRGDGMKPGIVSIIAGRQNSGKSTLSAASMTKPGQETLDENKTCPVCLCEFTSNDVRAFECDNCCDVPNLIWELAFDSIKSPGHGWSFVKYGVQFGEDNWQDHPVVVKRRVDEGTETRMVVSNVYCDSFEPATVDGDEIWSSKKDDVQKGVSYKNYKKHWHFTKPQNRPQTTTIEENRYPDTCPYCGSPAFEGLVWDCSKCDGRY